MITLKAHEIARLTKQNLTHGDVIYGAEGLKDWMLKNRYNHCCWLEMSRCHGAMQLMVKSGYLVKIRRGEFVKNPMID